MQEAVVKQMDFLRIMHPNKRVIIVTFSSDVRVWHHEAASAIHLNQGACWLPMQSDVDS